MWHCQNHTWEFELVSVDVLQAFGEEGIKKKQLQMPLCQATPKNNKK
jgi:hypothetical protein